MNDPAIRVENLGKLYRIGSARERNKTLREAVTDMIVAPWRSIKNSFREPPLTKKDEQTDCIWALKDVSFDVNRGDVVGIIGRNGAGKSTLLKILSRITEPTEGRVTLRGRVGSLLEVGTGFHSELTGEENIYLSGTILGMSSNEISRKFDEIVAFAEMGKFIHTPVKYYSSGMYMRLAFAVAAHLEPEILLVDEVLAVGDAIFQKKCLGKMSAISNEGRTILFVSHNMDAITTLCKNAIVLERGKLIHKGAVHEVVRDYLLMTRSEISYGEVTFPPKPELPMFLEAISTRDDDGNIQKVFPRSGAITIAIKLNITDPSLRYHVVVDIKTFDDFLLFRTSSFEQPRSFEILSGNGTAILECRIPPELLPPNTYRLGVCTAISGVREIQNIYPVLEFEIIQDRLLGDMFINILGVLTPKCLWTRVPPNSDLPCQQAIIH
jgi:lipopolysaccharide transport system ATP-binding protein